MLVAVQTFEWRILVYLETTCISSYTLSVRLKSVLLEIERTVSKSLNDKEHR